MENLVVKRINRVGGIRIGSANLSFSLQIPLEGLTHQEREKLIGTLSRMQRISGRPDVLIQAEIKMAQMQK